MSINKYYSYKGQFITGRTPKEERPGHIKSAATGGADWKPKMHQESTSRDTKQQ